MMGAPLPNPSITMSKKSTPSAHASTSTDREPPIDIGLTDAQRKKIAQSLDRVLGDAFTLYLMTHQFHWNVTGRMFNALHVLFEQQYTEQWTALDDIAERIRALGFPAPGSFSELMELSSIKEAPGMVRAPGWEDMVRQVLAGNEAFCRTARAAIEVASQAQDAPTEDLLIQRLNVHEKNAWMLRSLLQ